MNGENDSLPVPSTSVTGLADLSQKEPSSSHNVPLNPHRRRGRRGTRMSDVTLTRSTGSKLEIQFNDNLEPCGSNKSKYTSFVGTLARSKVSILTDEWKNVDKDSVKDPIWATILLSCTVPECPKLKAKTLSYCADRWRKFKTFLANKYIFADVQPDEQPWHKYTFIDEQTWQQFVQMRTTPEALKRREKAREIGRKNDCPHRASRGGYEKAEKDLMAAKRKRLEDEAESNPSAVVDQPPSPIRREELWLHIRQKPSGAYTSEQTRVVAERIENLKKKEAEGSFMSDGRNDVLTVATGKPDHPGRVRGIGGRVGLKQIFGTSKRHKQSMVTREEMEQTVAQTVARLTEQSAAREELFHSQLSQMKEEMNQMRLFFTSQAETSVRITQSHAHMQQSTRGSCIVGQSLMQPCALYVEDGQRLRSLVAKGTVHNLGSTVHHQEMADDEVRVSVEEVIIDAPLPLPTDQLKLVSDVKGSFVSWPVKLVDFSTHTDQVPAPPTQAQSPPPPAQAQSPPPPAQAQSPPPPTQAQSLPPPAQAQSPPPPAQAQSPPPPTQAPPPPPDQAPSPTSHLMTAREKITYLMHSGYFKDRSWPSIKPIVGIPTPVVEPLYIDTVDIRSVLIPRQEVTNPIIHLWMK